MDEGVDATPILLWGRRKKREKGIENGDKMFFFGRDFRYQIYSDSTLAANKKHNETIAIKFVSHEIFFNLLSLFSLLTKSLIVRFFPFVKLTLVQPSHYDGVQCSKPIYT